MSTGDATRGESTRAGVSVAGLRSALFTTRNLVFLVAVLAMNYTLMRPSPVDMLYILSFLMTLFLLTAFVGQEATQRALTLTLIVAAWAVAYFVASLPHLGEPFVIFELLAKTFAIMIAIISAFVSMTWSRRHFETFMKVYIVSCVIASILGTIGFVLQTELLTWDGRAKGFIDDPNMYGSFLIPAVMFCAYFMFRPQGQKLLLVGAILVILLGIILSFSRIATVAVLGCLFAYVIFHNRERPQRLIFMAAGLVAVGTLLFAFVSLTSSEFTEKFLDRLTFAKSYDLGEEGRYGRYLLVLPMILQNPVGVGVLQLEKIFPEPIHNIWLSSFVNYGWLGGFSWITLVLASVVVSIRNYLQTRSDVTIVLLISLISIVMCASLHEGEHWRHMWLMFGLVWGVNAFNFGVGRKPTVPNPVAGNRPAPPRRAGIPDAARPGNNARAPVRAERLPRAAGERPQRSLAPVETRVDKGGNGRSGGI